MSYTTRLTPAERKIFKWWSGGTGAPPEPALGTLDERLSIIMRRFGAPTRIVLTKAEHAELESYRVS